MRRVRAPRRRLCPASASPGGRDQAPPQPVARQALWEGPAGAATPGQRDVPRPPAPALGRAQDLRTPTGHRSRRAAQRPPNLLSATLLLRAATKEPDTSGTVRASRLCEGGASGAPGDLQSRAAESAGARACARRAPWELGAPRETASGSRCGCGTRDGGAEGRLARLLRLRQEPRCARGLRPRSPGLQKVLCGRRGSGVDGG